MIDTVVWVCETNPQLVPRPVEMPDAPYEGGNVMPDLVVVAVLAFLAGGAVFGAGRDMRLINVANRERDRRGEAEERLSMAQIDPLTGSSFTPRPRGSQRRGWTPTRKNTKGRIVA
ncbi:hypothetical protein [Phytoactinopolyspora halophila]|uniref:hypothetical protein n=1 Tax=Phytoactinopolyspora halophila TaxID=1981511 RepID=UPI00131446ED|nr:hypothetical protein [Phytoactinopolyspora halophila]